MIEAEEDQIFLMQVDELDNPIGLVEKKEAHLQGILHRAFSIFIFREKGDSFQVLLQQRAFHKYHSGGLWTNTCCGHAESNVSIERTAQNRLRDEMGFSCPLSFVGSFYYKTGVGNKMTEHEIDHVFAALHDPSHIHLNHEEADAYKWVDIDHLQELIAKAQYEFTAWFPEAIQIGLKFIKQIECGCE